MRDRQIEQILKELNYSDEGIAVAIKSGKNAEKFSDNGNSSVTNGIIIAANLYDRFNGLKGIDILDIGCGSSNQKVSIEGLLNAYTDNFSPDIARTLAFAGANVDGIDIGKSNQNEPYNHIVSNLTTERISDIISKGKKYNCIIANSFFSSPLLSISLKNSSHRLFTKRICEEVDRLLNNNGIFIVDLGYIENDNLVNLGFSKLYNLSDITPFNYLLDYFWKKINKNEK